MDATDTPAGTTAGNPDAAPDAAAIAAAEAEGRAAAARDPFAPNPYHGNRALFRAWMTGFFAAQRATPAAAPAALPPARPAPAPPPPATRIRPEPVLRLDAPGFAVRYPRLVNASLIPPGALAVMDETWTRFEFPPTQVTMLHVPGGIIVDEGLVFSSDLRVVEQTAESFTDTEIAAARQRIRAAIAAGGINRFTGASVLCKRRSAFNYGHFLLEMFPRAYLARQLMPQQRLNYIFDRTTPLMLDVAYRSLFQLGIGLDQMAIAGPEPQRHDDLFLVEGLSDHGRYLSPLAVASVESLGLTVLPAPPRRLFVRRGGTEQRNLVNQDAVAERFAAAGWEVIDPAVMTLVEQMTAFRAAGRVVGVGGAAMANIAFCEPGTPVTLLVHAHMPDTFFWFIANIKRMDYAELRCAPAGAQDAATWNGDFVAAETDIASLLGG